MLNELILCLVLAVVPASFSYFIDYCLGHPMSDKINTKAILFRYSLWLAKRRVSLKKEREIVSSLAPLLNNEDQDIRRQGLDQLKLSLMTSGREFFSYEQAIGMCVFCTNFWVSLLSAFIFSVTLSFTTIHPIFLFIALPIFSHTILRKL